MKAPLAGLLTALSLGGAAAAQSVSDCDWQSSAWALLEPWETYSRTFANGAVRIAVLDVVEPGQAPLHILVLSPPYDELNIRQCKQISYQGTRGFADLDFRAMTAGYDPAQGLTFAMPVWYFVAGSEQKSKATLRFSLNQSTGQVDPHLEQ